MITYQEFSESVNPRAGKRRHVKVTNSWGIYDAYKAIRRNLWYDIGRPLSEHEFYSIVRQVNNYLAEEVGLGKTVAFPSKMGKLELRKFETKVSLVDGKLKITYPIDWDRTLRLWFEDQEAHKNKTLLRNETKYVYHVRYDKFDANYENKSFYEFTLNRSIKRALKDNINKGIVDTLW